MRVQFGTLSIFALITAVAVLCALVIWLLDSSFNQDFELIPPLFVPSIPMMGIGIVILPFVCLPTTVALLVVVAKTSPRPYSIIVFIGLQVAAFFVDVSYWGNGIRLVLAMLLALIAMFVEMHVRRIVETRLVLTILTAIIVACWYVAVICIAASAGV